MISGTATARFHMRLNSRFLSDGRRRLSVTTYPPFAGVIHILLIALVLIACGGPVQADPDAGHIRFGASVDTTTFELSGRGTAFEVGSDVAYRAAMPRDLGPTTIRLVGTLNGLTVVDSSFEVNEANWTLYVGTIPGSLLFEEGAFEMRVLDVGNNELASGSFTVG